MLRDPRLPPGQSPTRKFPVVGERFPAPGADDPTVWKLTFSGLIRHPLDLSWGDYLAFPKAERVVDLHCVTGWTRFATRLSGLPLAELLARVEPTPEARFVRFLAHSDRGHDTSLPLALADADTWLVHAIDGLPLTPEHGGPLRTVTPTRYFYKSLKWVRHIELLAEDRLGYWERESAYHNVGDPWPGDQRFSTGSVDPGELARLRAGESLAPWRAPRKVVLSVDLRNWQPRDRDLRRLQLKNCDLRGADLAGADLREANLSLSNLRHARLANADLRAADLEGCDLAGADLRGADLSGAALSATRFSGEDDAGALLAAEVAGLRAAGVTGLLEADEWFLRSRGVELGRER